MLGRHIQAQAYSMNEPKNIFYNSQYFSLMDHMQIKQTIRNISTMFPLTVLLAYTQDRHKLTPLK